MVPCRILIAIIFIMTVKLSFAANVQFYIFKESRPGVNVRVIIDSHDYYTDDSGILDIDLKSGRYIAKIYSSKNEFKEITLNVQNAETLVVNYTLKQNEKILRAQNNLFSDKDTTNQKTQKIKGVVRSINHEAIKGVRILVHGQSIETLTNKRGEFEMSIPLGTHTLSFLHKNYSSLSLEDIEIQSGKTLNKHIQLKPSGFELEEFVVLSPNTKSSINALLEIRRSHQSVADLIGSEQISKSGDSNAGSSLRRVTGISLVDGKYVYVRGLGERYSNTLLNSSLIPSPDPSRRVVALDLFPSSVIENMVVQKGYSPEMPGEFGGGIIEIKTKTLPDKKYLNFSLSQNYDGGGDLQTYSGGGQDLFGSDDGTRNMPSLLKKYLDKNVNISTLSSEERKELAASLDKSYNTRDINGSDYTKIPNFTLSFGDKMKLGRARFGYNISTLYNNRWTFEEQSNENFNQSSNGLVSASNSNVEQSQNNTKLAGIVGLGLDYKKNKLRFNTTLLKSSQKLVQLTEGVNSESESYRRTQLGWTEKKLQVNQLSGEHRFQSLPDFVIDWNYSQSRAELYEPDNKMYMYIKQGDDFELETENGSAGNSVSWNKMPDDMSNFSLNLAQKVETEFLDELELKFGLNSMSRVRDFESRTFYYRFDESNSLVATDNPDTVFDDDDAELYQQSNNTDNYKASQDINAYYTNIKMKYDKLNFSAGVRYERSVQLVESFKLFNAGTTSSELITEDYLPALTATYKINGKMQLRANISETISRPDLREISKTVWNDVEQGAKYRGNPNLVAAQIQNLGLRYEWFYGRGEVFSFGYFRKEFKNPIEEIFGSLSEDGDIVGTTDNQYTFLNIESAINQGLELDIRKKINNDFTIGANYTWIKSEVNIAEDQSGQLTTLNRALQGQSPYLYNIQLDYEPSFFKGHLSLLYNEMGRRITGVGVDKRPDEYQESVSSLDFVASKDLYKNWKIKFRAKNLLDPKIERTQGDKTTRLSRNGQEYYLGLNGVF